MWKQKVHTDEYEISLAREIAVCRSTIQRIRKTLELLEQKHRKTTEVFIEEVRTGKLTDNAEYQDDRDVWQGTYESLLQWQALEKQYQEALRQMKI